MGKKEKERLAWLCKAEELLAKQKGWEVQRRGDVGEDFDLEIRVGGIINPADMRSKIAELLSTAGYQGYWLKEVYFFMASKKPFRTDEEGYVEMEFGEDFKQDKAQANVQKLNMKIAGNVKITPLATKEA
jgi:hypothetical protein